jgi:NADPH2:quinone reductase
MLVDDLASGEAARSRGTPESRHRSHPQKEDIMRAVRYDRFEGIDGLSVDDTAGLPEAGEGQVVLRVEASCINPGSLSALNGSPYTPIRDLAGTVTAVAADVLDFAVGDEVLGWVQVWSAHAESVAVPAAQLIAKPAGLSWDVAASLFVTPMAGLGALKAVDPKAGEILVIAGASGGVGLTSAQLAVRAGATVIGLAGATSADVLRAHGIVPVDYSGDRLAGIREAAAGGAVDAFIDAVGGDYIDLALELGVGKERITTVVDYKGSQEKGVTFAGTITAGGTGALSDLAALAAAGELDIPIGRSFPLAEVQDAYRAVRDRSTTGRVVLHPQA